MGKFDGILIASDFDGTLTNDSGIIPQEVREAIRWFISEGGYFAVSTGRSHQGFHLYDESYINAPVLLANGAMAFDYKRNEIVFCDGIGEEGIAPVNAIHEAFPSVAIEMYPFGATYAINLTAGSERHFTSQGISFQIIRDASESVFPWAKAMIGAGDKSSAVQCFLDSMNSSGIWYLPTTGGYIELLRRNIDKGTGLHKLASSLGIAPENTFAVGDGYNDVDMLKAAACGFVPQNGSAEALAVAGQIVRSNNEGAVANVIELLAAGRDSI